MKKKNIAIAISGASGAIYAQRLLKKIKGLDNQIDKIAIVFSENAKQIWQEELHKPLPVAQDMQIFENNDFYCPLASGSNDFDAMIIVPASMGIVGRIANGISDDLISRAADVMLKERRKLIVVPRETPYNLVHIRNMETITLAGGIICPATPSFYQNPQNINELADTVVDRIIDLVGLQQKSFRWGD
ncbi:MAG: 3-octaprenyl-4-hydroxybenzoate carboxy-lyase [Salinivirgaceae bacterium]|nr:MAG: 3-octaprenyl-4-hydroxybenzoate carboxy-lyase [Salinivirgaceae bacterium]